MLTRPASLGSRSFGRLSDQQRQVFAMARGKCAGFDFKLIIPVALSRPLDQIAPKRQATRLPLLENMEVLVQHEVGIGPELMDRTTQQDSVAASCCTRSDVHSSVERIFDHSYVRDRLTEDLFEGLCDMHRQRCATAEHHSSSVTRCPVVRSCFRTE